MNTFKTFDILTQYIPIHNENASNHVYKHSTNIHFDTRNFPSGRHFIDQVEVPHSINNLFKKQKDGAGAHYVMVSKIQWKPFWFETQLYPQHDWTDYFV